MTKPGEVFRALHHEPRAFVIPNPWDVGSARILAGMGFKALATTSSGMAFARGLPDGVVSARATLDHCRDIVAATPLPVSADLERGFGDTPESVAETVTVAAGIGLAGCSIEDHTGNPDTPIYETTLAIERIQAACDASRALPDDFVVTARCENLLWDRPCLDDVIAQLQAYEAAGADVLYAPGLTSLDAIRTLCSAVSKPVNVVMETPGATFTVDQLSEAGVKRVSIGSAFAQLAYSSLVISAREITENGRYDFTGNTIGYGELEAFFRPPTDG